MIADADHVSTVLAKLSWHLGYGVLGRMLLDRLAGACKAGIKTGIAWGLSN